MIRWISVFALVGMVAIGHPAYAQAEEAAPQAAAKESPYTPPTLWIEALTWPEIAMALRSDYRTIIIPTAGIEQNGPHMPLYKHRKVIHTTAEMIALRMGGTLIAPIVDFVPEGDIKSREGHMAYPGTISMPPQVFASIIENAARSLLSQGFLNVIFIGDSADNQDWQERVAKKLRDEKLSVYHIDDYYANQQQEKLLRNLGFTDAQIGGHSGLRDTSEFMAVAGSEIRKDRLENVELERYDAMGCYGDATLATPAIGIQLLQLKVDRAMAAICRLNLGFDGCAAGQ